MQGARRRLLGDLKLCLLLGLLLCVACSPAALPPTLAGGPAATLTPHDATPAPPALPPPTATVTPAPVWGSFAFSATFSPAGMLGSPGVMFPQRTQQVFAALSYQHVDLAAPWVERWYYDDELWFSRVVPREGRAASGTLVLSSLAREGGLPVGSYRLEFWVDDELVQTGYFFILADPPTATPTATATATRTVTPTRTATPTVTPTPDLAARLRLAYRAVVRLEVARDGGEGPIWGSGVVVDARGLILVNLHTVLDPWTGQPYSATGQIIVGVSDDPLAQAPAVFYLAKVVATSPTVGLAILYVHADAQGRPVPRRAFLPVATLGDDQALATAPDIHACGYAGAGHAEAVHGLYAAHAEDGRWLRFTAPAAALDDGIAFDDQATVVGIVSSVERAAQGSLYYARPIGAAQPLIAQARRWLNAGGL